jgi:transcriptional regulator with XRE-family HTH domain
MRRMPPSEKEARLRIGEVLKRTRTRQGIDISKVEQEIKVRTKYLRALESEEWEVLPGPAYAKGFLRTYAQFLGLDGDALVDEYRRTVEAPRGGDHPYLLAEPLLERRRRPGEEQQRGWRNTASAIAALGAVAVAVLLVLGLTGGSGEKRGQGHHHQRNHAAQGDRGNGPNASQGPPASPVVVALKTHDDMEVCLVTGDGRALIDSQTLVSEAKEGPFQPPADHYRLDLVSGGAVTLRLDGKPHLVRSKRPASFEISSGEIKPIDFKGPDCP